MITTPACASGIMEQLRPFPEFKIHTHTTYTTNIYCLEAQLSCTTREGKNCADVVGGLRILSIVAILCIMHAVDVLPGSEFGVASKQNTISICKCAINTWRRMCVLFVHKHEGAKEHLLLINCYRTALW